MKWLSKSYVGVVMAFLYAPIAVLIVFSFNQSKSRGAWKMSTSLMRWPPSPRRR